MIPCGCCRKPVRKTRFAYLSDEGALRRTRVCAGCHGDGITIVTRKAPAVVKTPREGAALLAQALKLLRARVSVKASTDVGPGPHGTDEWEDGRAAGTHAAIATIERLMKQEKGK